MKRYAPIVVASLVILGAMAVIFFRLLVPQPEGGVCPMDAKLCPDGSAVGRSGPECAFAPCPRVSELNEMVRLFQPKANALIESPLTIRGEARGNWFFEASFPVRLLDANGKELVVAPAQATGDWMTTDFVSFEVSLSFPSPTTSTGTLVLERDNPSGLPENADEVRIPVRFSPQD